jgi:hypothetical protein
MAFVTFPIRVSIWGQRLSRILFRRIATGHERSNNNPTEALRRVNRVRSLVILGRFHPAIKGNICFLATPGVLPGGAGSSESASEHSEECLRGNGAGFMACNHAGKQACWRTSRVTIGSDALTSLSQRTIAAPFRFTQQRPAWHNADRDSARKSPLTPGGLSPRD